MNTYEDNWFIQSPKSSTSAYQYPYQKQIPVEQSQQNPEEFNDPFLENYNQVDDFLTQTLQDLEIPIVSDQIPQKSVPYQNPNYPLNEPFKRHQKKPSGTAIFGFLNHSKTLSIPGIHGREQTPEVIPTDQIFSDYQQLTSQVTQEEPHLYQNVESLKSHVQLQQQQQQQQFQKFQQQQQAKTTNDDFIITNSQPTEYKFPPTPSKTETVQKQSYNQTVEGNKYDQRTVQVPVEYLQKLTSLIKNTEGIDLQKFLNYDFQGMIPNQYPQGLSNSQESLSQRPSVSNSTPISSNRTTPEPEEYNFQFQPNNNPQNYSYQSGQQNSQHHPQILKPSPQHQNLYQHAYEHPHPHPHPHPHQQPPHSIPPQSQPYSDLNQQNYNQEASTSHQLQIPPTIQYNTQQHGYHQFPVSHSPTKIPSHQLHFNNNIDVRDKSKTDKNIGLGIQIQGQHQKSPASSSINKNNGKNHQIQEDDSVEERFIEIPKTPSPTLKSQSRFANINTVSPTKNELNWTPIIIGDRSVPLMMRKAHDKVSTLPPGEIDQYVTGPTEDKLFICNYDGCGKTFTRRYNVRSHVQTHLSDRPFVCDHEDCNKAFVRQHDLTRHKKIHEEFAFRCECGKKFSRQDALFRHRIRNICIGGLEKSEIPSNMITPSSVSKSVQKSKKKQQVKSFKDVSDQVAKKLEFELIRKSQFKSKTPKKVINSTKISDQESLNQIINNNNDNNENDKNDKNKSSDDLFLKGLDIDQFSDDPFNDNGLVQ
ncbi:hypothetical protein WICMUC_002131 [Wickerhamomyces mucosus]|uniref:C2H2-type domain-containing protein n=1 Tax=Wickerhamomyces mucosus TaxID=1378264 RepID=A0A9P8PRP8_9ASCO|nr:hypothetical protein WICMUC_002131 [Wickerhamomyces mucosus]